MSHAYLSWEKTIMKICGIQKVSLVDYNGHICSTLFTSGCNFACPFCHNSGLVKGTEEVIPTEDILDYLEKRKNVIDSVCISGGEPTLQPDLPDFIRTIKGMGYNVKLDTNGTNLDMLKYLVENNLIDYIAMDIKNSLEKYNLTIDRGYTLKIKETIEYIMSCGIPYEFRTTLVREFHDEKDMYAIADMLDGARLYYLQKFEDSGNCLQSGLHPVDKESALHFQDILTKTIKNTHLRGY